MKKKLFFLIITIIIEGNLLSTAKTSPRMPISTGQSKKGPSLKPVAKHSSAAGIQEKQDPQKILSTSYTKNISKEALKRLLSSGAIVGATVGGLFIAHKTSYVAATAGLIPGTIFPGYYAIPLAVVAAVGFIGIVATTIVTMLGIKDGITKTRENRRFIELPIPIAFNFDTLNIDANQKALLKENNPKTIREAASIKGMEGKSLKALITAVLKEMASSKNKEQK